MEESKEECVNEEINLNKASKIECIPTHLTKTYLNSCSQSELITFIMKNKQKLLQEKFKYFDSNKYERKMLKKKINWDKGKYIKIAFKLGYLGKNYQGSEIQINQHNTIEYYLFGALVRCCLVKDPKHCGLSRCGRTDAGVSALGNVISLWVREQTPKKNEAKFMHYCTMINRCLPTDIRLLDFSIVPYNFDARFSCLFREYEYFFVKGDLNLPLMERAAMKFLGSLDFQNLCKKDIVEGQTFVRSIYEIEIKEVHPNAAEDRFSVYSFRVKGSGFLWHQIRCMVQILFYVASGRENIDIIDYLLATDQCTIRPNYNFASEIPLILTKCGFEDAVFENSVGGYMMNYNSMKQKCTDHLIDFALSNCFVKYFQSVLIDSTLLKLDKIEMNIPEGGVVEWKVADQLYQESRRQRKKKFISIRDIKEPLSKNKKKKLGEDEEQLVT